jgi:hypothetical protein
LVAAGLGFGGDFAIAQQPEPRARETRQTERQRVRQEMLQQTDAMVEAVQAEVARVAAQLEELQYDLKQLRAIQAVLHGRPGRPEEPEIRRAARQPVDEPEVPAPRPSSPRIGAIVPPGPAPPAGGLVFPEEERPQQAERVRLPSAPQAERGEVVPPRCGLPSAPQAERGEVVPPRYGESPLPNLPEGPAGDKPEMPKADEEGEPEMPPPLPPWPGDDAIREARGRDEAQIEEMIAKPHIIKVGDYLQVEVLEVLPGRPVSGFRRVRSDGTISLGFYGDLRVAGLSRRQVKSKLVHRMRRYLKDEVLGLFQLGEDGQWKPLASDETDRVWIDDEPVVDVLRVPLGYFGVPSAPAITPSGDPLAPPTSSPSLESRLGQLEEKLDRVLQTVPAVQPGNPQ